MSSILTNTSAMVALQTMRSINQNLADTQSQIATGMKVGSAKDNAAIWSISRVMESDVKGFRGIQESLSLGESTVAVARQASETVTDLLTDMKGMIVAAQEENVDRDKIQADIDALRNQIQSVVGAAQFNGQNLVDGSSTDPMRILSSLDRNAAGAVNSAEIEVGRVSLSVEGPIGEMQVGDTSIDAADRDGVFSNGTGTDTQDLSTAITWATANTEQVTTGSDITLTVGQAFQGASYGIALTDIDVIMADGSTTQGSHEFAYVASANDGVNDVAAGLVSQLNAFFASSTPSNGAGEPSYTARLGENAGEIVIENESGGTVNVGIAVSEDGEDGLGAGVAGLGSLQNIDVVNNAGAALDMIDGLIDRAIDAAAAFGSVQGRIETQSNFVSNLIDSLNTGIGTLVDADLEEQSARLQALQVQQQLATQSLSIANQQPQNILALFR